MCRTYRAALRMALDTSSSMVISVRPGSLSSLSVVRSWMYAAHLVAEQARKGESVALISVRPMCEC